MSNSRRGLTARQPLGPRRGRADLKHLRAMTEAGDRPVMRPRIVTAAAVAKGGVCPHVPGSTVLAVRSCSLVRVLDAPTRHVNRQAVHPAYRPLARHIPWYLHWALPFGIRLCS
jgi:hypothetical protein